MKTIYLTIIGLLQSIPELKFIDLDKGQLDYYDMRPNVAFPAAVIELLINLATDNDYYSQRVNAQLIVRLAFDYTGETSAATPETIRDNSLAFFDIVESVFSKLQGYSDANIDTISRRSMRPIQRQDGYKEMQLLFDVWYNEEA